MLVDLFGEQAHGLVGEDVVEAVVGHVVAEGDVAVFEAFAAFFEHVGCAGHRFLPAGDDDVEFSGADELVGEGDGVDAGEAHFVDAQGGDVHGDAGGDGGLAGGHLAGAGGEDLSHDDVVDVFGGDSGLVEGAFDGDAAEVGPGEVFQRSEESTQGRSSSRNNHGGCVQRVLQSFTTVSGFDCRDRAGAMACNGWRRAPDQAVRM